ncbi:probable G-protein coupled receptor 139 [Heterodontus francisci]|uniref:probable G-protein coupled receptor 139 n=1 Tax=Heterodontus francisci TaxID=7792 RepID=UPI00355C2E5D
MHATAKDLVFSIYYPVLAAIGVPANLAVMVILWRGRCGLSRCITYYLVSMAVSDLLVIITAVILNRIAGIYFAASFLSITPVCSLRSALSYAIIDCSVWVTVAFTFDRFMAICCQKLKIKYCTEKTAARVIGTVSALSCLKNIFAYFIYKPFYIINNIPWLCSIKAAFYTSPAWIAYDWIRRILTPCLPFCLILLLNALTVRHILVASGARRRLRAHSNGETQSDPEMEKRRKSIVLLFAISGSFILLYLVLLINFLYVRIAKLSYFSGSNFNQSNFILQESGFMLQLLSSCVNPFIYAGTQRKFREELKNGVKYPSNLTSPNHLCTSFIIPNATSWFPTSLQNWFMPSPTTLTNQNLDGIDSGSVEMQPVGLRIAVKTYPSQTVHLSRLERLRVPSDYSTLGRFTDLEISYQTVTTNYFIIPKKQL